MTVLTLLLKTLSSTGIDNMQINNKLSYDFSLVISTQSIQMTGKKGLNTTNGPDYTQQDH